MKLVQEIKELGLKDDDYILIRKFMTTTPYEKVKVSEVLKDRFNDISIADVSFDIIENALVFTLF